MIDLRGLAPPEPLLRILDTLGAGEGPFTFLLSREPYPLYPMLARDGWAHRARRSTEGCELTIYRKVDAA